MECAVEMRGRATYSKKRIARNKSSEQSSLLLTVEFLGKEIWEGGKSNRTEEGGRMIRIEAIVRTARGFLSSDGCWPMCADCPALATPWFLVRALYTFLIPDCRQLSFTVSERGVGIYRKLSVKWRS